MIYTGLNNTGEVEAIYGHLNGVKSEVSEVYGSIDYNDPIFYSRKTFTGTSPLTYKALGQPLSDYLISGNTVQNGTPTRSAPVDAVGCGVRTENLFDISVVEQGGWAYDSQYDFYKNSSFNRVRAPIIIPIRPEKTYTISVFPKALQVSVFIADENNHYKAGTGWSSTNSKTISNGYGACITIRKQDDRTISPAEVYGITVVEGSTPPDTHIPYGYKLPLTVNGTEYPIYLGQVETTRRIKKLVLTGEELALYRNPAIKTSNAFYITQVDYLDGTLYGFCTHYPTVSQTSAVEGMYFGKNISIFTKFSDGFDTVEKLKSYLAAQYANGTPVTVWYVLTNEQTGITNEPLHKIGDYADTVSFAQAGVTIPTVTGTNTLTVDTTVQPSEVSITGHIKPTGYGQLLDVNDVDIQDSTGEPIYIQG